MHVVTLAVHFNEQRLEVATHLGKQFAQPVDSLLVEHFSFQEERPVGQLPLPTGHQARPRQQPRIPAEARLDSLPEQPRRVGRNKKRDRQPVMR